MKGKKFETNLKADYFQQKILIKFQIKKIKNEANEQKDMFLRLLLGTLGASLLGNLLTGKGTIRAGQDF